MIQVSTDRKLTRLHWVMSNIQEILTWYQIRKTKSKKKDGVSPSIVFCLRFLSFNLRLGKIGTWPIVVFNIYVEYWKHPKCIWGYSLFKNYLVNLFKWK